MQLLISVLTHWRCRALSRQAGAVRTAVQSLNPQQRRQAAEQTLEEIRVAARLPQPHLHGEPEGSRYRPWSRVAATAAGRMQDRSILLRQRSIALWLAVVYHETRGAPDPNVQAVHRLALGLLRELKDNKLATADEKAWFDAAA